MFYYGKFNKSFSFTHNLTSHNHVQMQLGKQVFSYYVHKIVTKCCNIAFIPDEEEEDEAHEVCNADQVSLYSQMAIQDLYQGYGVGGFFIESLYLNLPTPTLTIFLLYKKLSVSGALLLNTIT